MSDHSSDRSVNLYTLGSIMRNQPQRIFITGEHDSGSLIGSVEQGTPLLTILPLDASLVSSDVPAIPQDAIFLDADGDAGPIYCCQGNKPHKFHMFLLHTVGGFCIVFGCVEIGLGLRLHDCFSNLTTGVWWAGVPVVIAGEPSSHG